MNERARLLHRVRVQGLVRTFGATPVLRGVGCDFAAGTVTMLTGENGAGKTTLLSIVGTALRPTRGEIRYETARGELLSREEVRARLGWVTHEPLGYFELTTRENLELYAKLQGAALARLDAVAEQFQLATFLDRPLGKLSRGQRQRLGLARALVHQPDLLLLDEPFTGLDTASAALLESAIRAEAQSGAVVALVTHQPELLGARLGAIELRLAGGRIRSTEP